MGFSRRKIYPRLGGAIFWGGFFAIPIADTVVLSCVPKVFMQTAEIPDVSLPIGRGATQHFGSSCSFFSQIFCVWPLFMCCHLASRFYMDFWKLGCVCKCQVSSTGRRRFFGTLWCRPWRAPMDLETRGSSSGCHWSWMIKLTRKERWQNLQMFFYRHSPW